MSQESQKSPAQQELASTKSGERRIVVVTAGLSQPSSSRMLADRLADATVRQLEARGESANVETVELRDFATDITNNLLTGFPSARLSAVLETLRHADGLIAVSPIFSASYSGLFKSFFDILDPDALTDLPVLIGATGGTPRHSLALEHALRPLFGYLRADVASTAVYAASEDWGSASDALASLPERMERAGRQFADKLLASDRAGRVTDPFALDPSFSPTGGFTAS